MGWPCLLDTGRQCTPSCMHWVCVQHMHLMAQRAQSGTRQLGTPQWLLLCCCCREGDAVAFEAGKLQSNATSTTPPPVTGPGELPVCHSACRWLSKGGVCPSNEAELGPASKASFPSCASQSSLCLGSLASALQSQVPPQCRLAAAAASPPRPMLPTPSFQPMSMVSRAWHARPTTARLGALQRSTEHSETQLSCHGRSNGHCLTALKVRDAASWQLLADTALVMLPSLSTCPPGTGLPLLPLPPSTGTKPW